MSKNAPWVTIEPRDGTDTDVADAATAYANWVLSQPEAMAKFVVAVLAEEMRRSHYRVGTAPLESMIVEKKR